MDMSGMDMSGMDGGMDAAGSMMFVKENQKLARTYWYIIAAITGFLTLVRIGRSLRSRWSIKLIQRSPDEVPSRPRNFFDQSVATTVAILREISYCQPISFSGSFTRYLSPLSVGRWLLLALYWLTLILMLFTGVFIKTSDPMFAYHWEKVGFRAAWVSVTQVPFIFLLAGKVNAISLLTGISYERLNWIHRWAARTLFFTVIVHWSFFFREWDIADFVSMEISMMPMVKYGFGAWATIIWTILTGVGFVRRLCYELFVLQHLAGACIFLWLLYSHVPAYARYNIWMAVAFLCFDIGARLAWNIYQNVRLTGSTRRLALGYPAKVEALPGGFSRVTLHDTNFSWKAGQHIYLSIPRIGPVEMHPFTISNDQQRTTDGEKTATLLIKAEGGFTRRLHQKAKAAKSKQLNTKTMTARAFISGPFGNPPDLSPAETVVMISASTGATFTLPLLQDLASKPTCVKHVVFCWVCPEPAQVACFQKQILQAANELSDRGVAVSVRVNITCCDPVLCTCHETSGGCCGPADSDSDTEAVASDTTSTTSSSPAKNEKTSRYVPAAGQVTEKSVSSDSDSTQAAASTGAGGDVEPAPPTPALPEGKFCLCGFRAHARVAIAPPGLRPRWDDVVRPAVERAAGETRVVACGPAPMMAEVRSYVAALSDERAVHKGTGAQAIGLFTETFGW